MFICMYQFQYYHIAIEYKFFALNPMVYHIDNFLLHILNVILVFFFINLLTKKLNISAIVALFFAIHPMHVESVAWSGREKRCIIFILLSKWINNIYILFKKQKLKYLVYTFILFILSLLSKSTAVCFPLVLVLIDYYLKSIKFRSVKY